MQHGRPPHTRIYTNTRAQFVAPAKNRRNNYYPRDKVTGGGRLKPAVSSNRHQILPIPRSNNRGSSRTIRVDDQRHVQNEARPDSFWCYHVARRQTHFLKPVLLSAVRGLRYFPFFHRSTKCPLLPFLPCLAESLDVCSLAYAALYVTLGYFTNDEKRFADTCLHGGGGDSGVG